jgi:hypothetical protein
MRAYTFTQTAIGRGPARGLAALLLCLLEAFTSAASN